MMVSPYADQANSMNAEMVNLQSDKELDSFTKKVASAEKLPRIRTQRKLIAKAAVAEQWRCVHDVFALVN